MSTSTHHTDDALTPREIVSALDEYIIGQKEAKRAVAIALRNRWRRAQLPADLQHEITPKNILMIGPTGVGKTEISRRLAKLANAPFIKIEATKFTEVGYVGRDVDSIIRDLMELAIQNARKEAIASNHTKAESLALDRMVDVLVPLDNEDTESSAHKTREKFRQKLIRGELDEKTVEIEVAASGSGGMNIMTPPGMEDFSQQMESLFSQMSKANKQKKRVTVKEGFALFTEEEAAKLVNEEEVVESAKYRVENHGIVFLDEIDKVAKGAENRSGDVSREGVQRDLLPLVEGNTVTTKYGAIDTNHILFIASGAFHVSKPSDLIPELQGRLPIRVELRSLTVEDFKAILTAPTAALTKQYEALLGTEDLKLSFTDEAIERLATIAHHVNETTENIGARRLQTVMERLLESVSFELPDYPEKTLEITADYVQNTIGDLYQDQDLSRYIL